MATKRRWLAGVSTCALVGLGGAAADVRADERGADPHQGESLVEVHLPSKAAAIRLQLEAERYGVSFNEHYLRQGPGDSVAVTVFGDDDEIAALDAAGFEVATTIEGPDTWRNRRQAYLTDMRKEERAENAALDEPVVTPYTHTDELVVLRADYFENYAGRFLSVEAKTRLASVNDPEGPTPGTYTGPTLSLSWDSGPGTPIDQGPRTMNVNIDPDTTPDTYIEHRELLRIGDAGTTTPLPPDKIRIGSSSGATIEADVETWLDGGLPPMADGYMRDFTTRYMDPTEVYARFEQLAEDYSNIAELIQLPHETNGYQRRAQAMMDGTTPPGNNAPQSARAVILTSRAWGHEGGNDLTAEFVNPGQANSPLTVTMTGNDLVVRLGTDASGAVTSTAAQVVEAINANPGASAKLVARTNRGSTGTGVVQPRAKVNLSDFLSTATNAHVPRGPFQPKVMRIGKKRDGSKVGAFLYCQQHAREWATPLTCLETAEQLLTNYALDKRTRTLVDNLDIFILPSVNPDGAHFSIHNFNSQRRNMTNHCVVGGKETDDPNAANFWTLRTAPNGTSYVSNDPGDRNDWGVDLNRNNTFGTVFDGYIGADHDCESDVFAGPAEASEPEIKNEHWVADTFGNIKFSNNIHSFGGYFMWAPGTYLTDRGEGDAVHANIGIEKYFFEAGDRILNRIKEIRGTAILPARTGPIADVLYSAAGNSSDEHWYNRGVIAYSFETGADRFAPVAMLTATAVGATGIRVGNADRAWWEPGDEIVIDYGNANAERRTVVQVIDPNPQSGPNIILDAPLTQAHAAGAPVWGKISQVGVGFQPPYATEGKFEALEFAAGNYGLLESALDYARDETAPTVTMTGPSRSSAPIETTFEWDEPAVIHYTTDGSAPTEQSSEWDSTGPREPGEVFHVGETTTFRWRAEDIKGNVSYGRKRFDIR